MTIFALSKQFPLEEKYSLTDQIRRSSRSVCANIGEAWRKRRYKASFIAKLNDCEAEAAETQVWLKFAVKCDYLLGCCLALSRLAGACGSSLAEFSSWGFAPFFTDKISIL